ncbi:MAG TPA: hypothetical protein VFW45_00475 [Candidatus Polarisedimenticolia bacterium]|nr:hypothetical protein [Candidatus Polarisedimenticolia bacterium]
MTKGWLAAASIPILLGLAVLILVGGAGATEEIQRVFVANFPSVQKVSGSVSIEGTVRHGLPQHFKDLTVPPVAPTEVSRLIPAGVLETDGFTSVILALNGQSKKNPIKPGVVGAILVPDEDPVLRIFEEEGKGQFSLEIKTAAFSSSSPYVASDSQRYPVGFPRYRVWLYNTSDRTVSANLYAYLMN